MLYPKLRKKAVRRQTVSAFDGYEHRLRTSEGAFYDTRNLSTERYPLLSVRKRRGEYLTLTAPQGIIEKDALAYIDGGTLYYNGLATPLTGMSAGEKQLVSMGAYICVFPDKLYYNTADGADYGSMDAVWEYTGRVRYTLCDLDGEDYPAAEESAAEPAAPQDGDYWLNTKERTLSRYSVSMKMWVEVESVYVKLTFTTQGQIPSAFARYDGVRVSCAAELDGTKVLYAVGGSAGIAPDYADAESDYVVLVGSDGAWTGAVGYLGTPLFFKENCIHRVSVSATGAHQVGETVCRGVQRGSAKSLIVVNETLYYKSRGDVCAYQGGFPQGVSAALGGESYGHAAAGALGERYYISMRDAQGKASLFVYDIGRGLWMREDDLAADAFARVDDELFCLAGNRLYALAGTCGKPEARVEWSAETGMLTCEYPDSKYLARIALRAWMEREAELELFVEYDSSGVWEYAGRMRVASAGSAEFPLRLRRCDHARLRLEGRGDARILSMTREVTEG